MSATERKPALGECWKLKGQHQEDAHARVIREDNTTRGRVLLVKWRTWDEARDALGENELLEFLERCTEHPPLAPGDVR